MVVLWRSPLQQQWPRDIGRSLGKLCLVERWVKHRVGMPRKRKKKKKKARKCWAVVGGGRWGAGRADGGSEREQSEFQVWNCSLTQGVIGCSGFFLFYFVLNTWKIPLLRSPTKESISYTVRMQCAECWGCVQLVGNHVWPSPTLLGSELEERAPVMRAVLRCTKCCLQNVQKLPMAWKSKGGRKLMSPFYIQTYIFSVPELFIHCKSIFYSLLEISSDISKTHWMVLE